MCGINLNNIRCKFSRHFKNKREGISERKKLMNSVNKHSEVLHKQLD
jgi:hypothetical protein